MISVANSAQPLSSESFEHEHRRAAPPFSKAFPATGTDIFSISCSGPPRTLARMKRTAAAALLGLILLFPPGCTQKQQSAPPPPPTRRLPRREPTAANKPDTVHPTIWYGSLSCSSGKSRGRSRGNKAGDIILTEIAAQVTPPTQLIK